MEGFLYNTFSDSLSHISYSLFIIPLRVYPLKTQVNIRGKTLNFI